MKRKRLFSVLLSLVMLISLLPVFALPAHASGVAVDAAHFPDPVFLDYIKNKIDADSSGILSEAEIEAATEINFSSETIASLKGVEYFTALVKLSCHGNLEIAPLASVDLSQNTALKTVNLSKTKITALDLTANTALETLYCEYTPVKSLDLTGCSELKKLDLQYAAVTELDLSQFPKLSYLNVSWTPLTELDISACPILKEAYLTGTCKSTRPDWLTPDTLEDIYPYYWEYASENGHLMVNKTVAVFALPPEATVSFEADGGTGEMAAVSVVKGGKYTLPDCAFTAPEGKEFDKWEQGAPGEEIEITDDTVIKALWKDKPIAYWTVSFDADGGAGEMAAVSVVKGGKYTLPDCAFTAPEGKVFDKWEQGAPGEEIEITDDTAIKAIWKDKPIEYCTVSFEPNGGGGMVEPVVLEQGAPFVLPICAFDAPEGKEFDHWVQGAVGDTITVAADTILVPLWKDKPVAYWAVSFDADGGAGEMAAVSVVRGEKYTLPDCAFTAPEGKEFDKWEQGAPGEEIGITGDTVIKAVWKDKPAETCLILFNANGGEGEMEMVTVLKGEAYTLPDCAFTAPEGKEFERWDAGMPGEKIEITAHLAIKALWKDKAVAYWTVSFDADGGAGEMAAVSVVRGEKYTLPDCTFTAPEGKTFAGWDAGRPGDELEVAQDLTLKALWERVNPFVDVFETDYCYDAVLWAYYAEPFVTNGIDATHFGPDSTVTRGQAVTFLWRAMGEPEPTSTENPFTDVKETDYFYKAVLWAMENGITNGTDATHFTPSQTCSTAHIVTFLYRTITGRGNAGWYELAEGWAIGAGLMGDLALTVAPGVDCPRASVVYLLHRALAA